MKQGVWGRNNLPLLFCQGAGKGEKNMRERTEGKTPDGSGGKALLRQIAGLCSKASDEVFEDKDTENILNACDGLQMLIDEYLDVDGG